MIYLKKESEFTIMRKSARIIKDMMSLVEESIKIGMTTKELDTIAYDFIIKNNAKPACLNYSGFPATLCVSIDSQVIHGIPSEQTIIEEGQLVSVDSGVIFDGYYTDMSRTFEIGKVSKEKSRLNEITRQAFFEGVKFCKEGNRIGDISNAIQNYVESNGFSVVKEFVGHGIGKSFHEDPSVPNYGAKGRGVRLQCGMALAIEPMVNMGSDKINILDDGWTVMTKDGLPSAHYENTVIITDNGIEIITL